MLNVHFHALVLDGVYTASSALARPLFHPALEPDDDELAALLVTIRVRVLRLLRSRGLIDHQGEVLAPDSQEQQGLLPMLQAASIQGLVAQGPDAGRRLARVAHAQPRQGPSSSAALCVDLKGFSLHAAVRVRAAARKRLEQLQPDYPPGGSGQAHPQPRSPLRCIPGAARPSPCRAPTGLEPSGSSVRTETGASCPFHGPR